MIVFIQLFIFLFVVTSVFGGYSIYKSGIHDFSLNLIYSFFSVSLKYVFLGSSLATLIYSINLLIGKMLRNRKG